jgi:HlyD family secretion protein
MNAQTRRRAFVIVVSALVIGAVVYGFLPRPVTVDAVAVRRGPLRVTVDEEGKTRVKDRYVISAPVAGYLRRISLKAGDPIRKGECIAELEPLRSTVLDPRSRAEAQAAVEAAKAALRAAEENARAAEAEAEYAAQKLERSKQLIEKGFVSRDDLDQAETNAKRTAATVLSTRAAVNVSRSELERAKAVLAHSAAMGPDRTGEIVRVCSPVKGDVLKIHRESAGVVQAGDPLLDLGDPAKIEVAVEVLSADAVNIRKGTAVLFERWGGEGVLEGRVRVVEPGGFTKISSLGVEEQRVNVIVDFTSPRERWQGLGDAYRVEASFITWEGSDVLQVPASALFRKEEDWAVFVIDGNRARERVVSIGRRNGLAAEVLSGLTEGERVVAHPDRSVGDGVRVRVRQGS